jgi:hypothetical protein
VVLQFETIHQQILKHDVELIDAVWAIRFGLDIVQIGVKPAWTAGYLTIVEVEHELDHQLYRNVCRNVSLPAGQGFNASSIGAWFGGFDRGDVEFQSRRRIRFDLAESACCTYAKNSY